MYDLPGVESDVDALWAAVAERIDADPQRQRPEDLHEHWSSGEYLLSQTCGFPLVSELAGRVSVVGVFTTEVGHDDGSEYCSVIVVPVEPSDRHAPLAVNSWDSLSGWVSLGCVLTEPWTGEVVLTGGHRMSMREVAAGRASMASIDAVTLKILSRNEPDLLGGMRVVRRGPMVPCLPLITPDPRNVQGLRTALAAVVREPALRSSLNRLSITGFVPLDLSAYNKVHRLATQAQRTLPQR
jgi:ABC-type phosphate/phosphonate transport system substrate-binding protein